ncbi:MAG: hypothetical protein P8Y80_03750, partial [Acidobacteriota bacterium]
QDYSEEEYSQYQSIEAETDSGKKTDMTIQFFADHPESSLKPYLVSSFQRLISDLCQKKQWDEAITIGSKFLSAVPDDSVTIGAMAYAYSASNNQKGFVAFGTKVYDASPNKELAYSIAEAYLRLGNETEFLKWGDRVLEYSPDNVIILAQLLNKTAGARQAKYAGMALKALPKAQKPEEISDQAWKETVNASYAMSYGALGAAAYEDFRYDAAVKHLSNAVKYDKRNETAYFFLGMSYWRINQMDPAMLNFARAHVLGGSTSSQAKKYLLQLWSNSYGGSVAGMENLIQKAREELK